MTSKPASCARSICRWRIRRGATSTGASRLEIEQVAHDERGAFEPGHEAEGREVGPAGHVAVALVPVREAVAGQHVHVDIDRQEVVAALDAALDDFVEEVMTRHPLAHQPALLVGEHDEHGVDLVGVDHPGQGRQVQHASEHAGRLRTIRVQGCSFPQR